MPKSKSLKKKLKTPKSLIQINYHLTVKAFKDMVTFINFKFIYFKEEDNASDGFSAKFYNNEYF